MIVVLLGPPGSGKGTQAKRLSAEYRWPQLSTGDMLRSAIAKGSQVGIEAKAVMDQGRLVPDEVVIRLIAERSQDSDCKGGFILDGFPRNESQAAALDTMLGKQGRQVDCAVLFDISDQDLVSRLSGRRTCVKCGAMYHLEFAKPKQLNTCDSCGSALIQRDDDQPQVIKKRLEVYHQQTEPVVGYYTRQSKLKTVDAREETDRVAAAVHRALK
ncbi:MAG: adenylate kinase [Bdellovibrio sp.]|nr:adenylate kinase [Bdellovibrio sp.]